MKWKVLGGEVKLRVIEIETGVRRRSIVEGSGRNVRRIGEKEI